MPRQVRLEHERTFLVVAHLVSTDIMSDVERFAALVMKSFLVLQFSAGSVPCSQVDLMIEPDAGDILIPRHSTRVACPVFLAEKEGDQLQVAVCDGIPCARRL